MRTLLLAILLLLFWFLPSAYSQNYYVQPGSPEVKQNHHLKSSGLPKPTAIDTVIDTGSAVISHSFIDYYLADSTIYGPNNFMGLQGQLINNRYSFPKDTNRSYLAKSMFFMNYDCINAVSVAFDSIPGSKEDTISVTQIDTLFVPIIQVNHSNINDTLSIQLTTVDVHGYPVTNNYLVDTLIIDSNHTNNIGAGNDYTIHTIKWALGNYNVPGGRFAINITYYDSTKLDSCWFMYGYGSFNRTCSDEPQGDTIFASPTHFSNVTTNTRSFKANSFALWNGYKGLGYLPTIEGDNVFLPCTAADSDSFHPGVDGANYIQDIDIAANMIFTSYLGVPTIHPMGISVSQNYPNPYSNTTLIDYSLVKPADISLKIKDLAGRVVLSQNYGTMNGGQHSIMLNANSFSAGIYFYSITGSGYTVTKKMVVY